MHLVQIKAERWSTSAANGQQQTASSDVKLGACSVLDSLPSYSPSPRAQRRPLTKQRRPSKILREFVAVQKMPQSRSG
jgi:hypothetical protein